MNHENIIDLIIKTTITTTCKVHASTDTDVAIFIT